MLDFSPRGRQECVGDESGQESCLIPPAYYLLQFRSPTGPDDLRRSVSLEASCTYPTLSDVRTPTATSHQLAFSNAGQVDC
nr:hypothetical protein CFP56_22032 [Quercus suber]